jgi:peptide deformylase
VEIFNFDEIRKLSKKDIVTDYDSLSERCDEFDLTKKNNEVQTIVSKLKAVIRSDEKICALSANQLGYNKRIICINFDGDIRTFVNPIIDKVEGIELSKETCHSIPGKTFIRIRHPKINVTYQTPLGKIQSVQLIGMAARVMQHHIDHLDGLLLSDVGLEIDDRWDKATEEERQEVINYYFDSLDLKSETLNKEIKDDPEASKLSNAIKFINSVRKGETQIEQVPFTEEEIKIVKEFEKKQKEKKEKTNGNT